MPWNVKHISAGEKLDHVLLEQQRGDVWGSGSRLQRSEFCAHANSNTLQDHCHRVALGIFSPMNQLMNTFFGLHRGFTMSEFTSRGLKRGFRGRKTKNARPQEAKLQPLNPKSKVQPTKRDVLWVGWWTMSRLPRSSSELGCWRVEHRHDDDDE